MPDCAVIIVVSLLPFSFVNDNHQEEGKDATAAFISFLVLLSSHCGKRGRTVSAAGPHRSCIACCPPLRATGFELRPPPVTRCPSGPHHMEAGTLLTPNGSPVTPGRMTGAAAAQPQVLGLNRVLCASPVRENTATSMLTTGFLEASRCIAPLTRTWDTSMCITRCALGWAAISDLITATREAKPSTVSRTRSQVSVFDKAGLSSRLH